MNLPGIPYTVCNTNLNPSYAIQTACRQPHHKNNPKFTQDKKKKRAVYHFNYSQACFI